MNLKPFQQRVVDEKNELDAKREKLYAFVDSSMFSTLPDEEKERLKNQSIIMLMYSRILGERIGAFTE